VAITTANAGLPFELRHGFQHRRTRRKVDQKIGKFRGNLVWCDAFERPSSQVILRRQSRTPNRNCTPPHPMLLGLLKALEKELKLLDGGGTSVYIDLDSDQVGIVDVLSPDQRETASNQNPCKR